MLEYWYWLKFVFEIFDDGKRPWTDYDDFYLRNAYYKFHTSIAEVADLFVYNSMGELVHAQINFP